MCAAPDIRLARAAANLFAAWRNNRELKKLANEYNFEWSLIHTMTTNMGGVRITFDAETSTPGSHKLLAEDARGSDAEKYRGASRMETGVWTVDSMQLIEALNCRIIARLPDIPAKEIDDKNKSNAMVFLGAVVPLTYTALQLGARYHKDLPSTLLEIETLAFVTCAVPLYFIDMKKPMDLNVPFDIPASKCATPESFQSVAAKAPRPMMGWKTEYCSPGITNGSIHQTENGFRHSYIVMNCALISMAILFGGIHLFAWNYDFPTEIEQLLWRTAALSAMVLPILWVVVVELESHWPVEGPLPKHQQARKFIARVRWVVLAVPYMLARLFIIVESFRSLYFLHSDAYIATFGQRNS
jgi:hypothetical protein